MTKLYCDCCGEEITSKCMPISVPCHHLENNISSAYEDMDGNRTSGRYDKLDLCNRCSNEIFSEAMKKFYEIQEG